MGWRCSLALLVSTTARFIFVLVSYPLLLRFALGFTNYRETGILCNRDLN